MNYLSQAAKVIISSILSITAVILYLISDFTVFLPMLTLCREYNDFVWATYIPAQLLIILFNDDFGKEEQ